MKENNNFSYRWKFEPDIPNGFEEILRLKTRNFTEECIFCHPAISQFSMADISFNIACKELNITQTGQVNQLFQRKRHLKSEFALP